MKQYHSEAVNHKLSGHPVVSTCKTTTFCANQSRWSRPAERRTARIGERKPARGARRQHCANTPSRRTWLGTAASVDHHGLLRGIAGIHHPPPWAAPRQRWTTCATCNISSTCNLRGNCYGPPVCRVWSRVETVSPSPAMAPPTSAP